MSPKAMKMMLVGSIVAVLLTMTSLQMSLASSTNTDIPRPEHPRPDFYRESWLNLNGVWEFAETDDPQANYLSAPMPDTIVVPFCRESQLSGLERKGFVKYVWYRRRFKIPEEWKGKRVLFHVGACDWETTVWINGNEIGSHRGGNDPFKFDITDFLIQGENTVALRVYDDVRTGLQPAGKQSQREESHGIFYTRTTGIWQTVWLEAAPDTRVKNFSLIADIKPPQVEIAIEIEGDPSDAMIVIEAFAGEESVGKAEVPATGKNIRVALLLSEKRLWSPSHPFLYDLVLEMKRGGQSIDSVRSYFGLREVEIRGRAILLNGEPVFQRLVLDQGFYPDGVWTAPTDRALEDDIRLALEAGFNGARLHQKVFEPRFLYHADRLGYLVWGEYPSFGLNYSDPRIDESIVTEWRALLDRDRNHPSVIGWRPFNETPPQAQRIQQIVHQLTGQIDPTRPALETSGWTHTLTDPEALDAHDYDQDPVSYRERWGNFFQINWKLPARYGIVTGGSLSIPFFVSEFGGIGWDIGKGWGYGTTPKSMDAFYERFTGLVDANLDNRNFFGYCYTQLTDVEQEKNGIYTFSRGRKFDSERLRLIQSRSAAYENDPPLDVPHLPGYSWVTLAPTAHDGRSAAVWKYTLTDPGPGWMDSDFDASSWEEAPAGFGTRAEKWRGTFWETKDIWLRRAFQISESEWDVALLIVFYDNATEVHVNGSPLWKRDGHNNVYEAFNVSNRARELCKPGLNLMAVHTRQDEGGQYIDVGLMLGKRDHERNADGR